MKRSILKLAAGVAFTFLAVASAHANPNDHRVHFLKSSSIYETSFIKTDHADCNRAYSGPGFTQNCQELVACGVTFWVSRSQIIKYNKWTNQGANYKIRIKTPDGKREVCTFRMN